MSQRILSTLQPPDLLGEWALRRRIADYRSRMSGTVDGQLTLNSDARTGEIAWSESGALQWNGAIHAVTRTYLLREDSDGWWLFFADGRPFHPWQPGGWVEHPCRDDLYRGLVSITDSDRWGTVWDVSGPAKDLRILTRFSRPRFSRSVR